MYAVVHGWPLHSWQKAVYVGFLRVIGVVRRRVRYRQRRRPTAVPRSGTLRASAVRAVVRRSASTLRLRVSRRRSVRSYGLCRRVGETRLIRLVLARRTGVRLSALFIVGVGRMVVGVVLIRSPCHSRARYWSRCCSRSASLTPESRAWDCRRRKADAVRSVHPCWSASHCGLRFRWLPDRVLPSSPACWLARCSRDRSARFH